MTDKLVCGESTFGDAFDSINELILGNNKQSVTPYDRTDDPSIATVIASTDTTGLTKNVYYFASPELFRLNGYVKLDNDEISGIRLLQANGGDSGHINFEGENWWQTSATISFNVNCESCFIVTKSTTGLKSIRINGKYLDRNSNITAVASTFGYLVTFPSRATYEIEVLTTMENGSFKGVKVKEIDSVTAPSKSGVKTMYVGDSYSVDENVKICGNSWPEQVSLKMGWDNYLVSGIGGTGFISDNATSTNYIERISDVQAFLPDVLYVAATINDGSFLVTLQAAVVTYINAVRAIVPNCIIIIVGANGSVDSAFDAVGAEATTKLGYDELISSGVTDLYFMPSATNAVPLVSGTGDEGAPDGTGNADIFISDDNVHTSFDGQIHYASQVIKFTEELFT